ncbi:DUF4226 domain-containing protein [Mycolicibacter hiberniae]|uniref:Uncharacterized protein n=1 Tax=Mycolicibacter hiberniae TaxID=29314 RepID=A0A7I7X7M3_9MYCO|nr:DUF4226 domain-containing protein [Mycolicibacter hiberniae]MCV7088386.1 DUF4226 domain-containing protein [Mycolicibacter hiberniae]ORV65734.1 hypothetical protein AWC09_02415 [Mycolicibacter hiberniae]BBZ25245.1 hypothetical protein MHIB_36630 [Mycolicibacter hiberniae]
MATRDDVLDAIERITEAGRAGEATRVAQAALTLPLPPAGYDSVLTRLRAAYPLLDDQQRGRAAEAIKQAESALANQLSVTAEFDRQMVDALLQARKTTRGSRRRLDELEAEIATAANAWDLSTATGAREFQRFLITRLGQILSVVEEADEDDASKRALAAALTALYSSTPTDRGDRPSEQLRAKPPDSPVSVPADTGPWAASEPDTDPYLDMPLDGESQPDIPVGPYGVPPLPMSLPGLGAEGPGMGAMAPAMPPGIPWAGLTSGVGRDDLPEQAAYRPDEMDAADESEAPPDDGDEEASPPDPGAPGPVTVRLPDGHTTTVDDPHLAAAMQAVVDGQPVVEAFRSQGIHIPPPGTPVVAAVAAESLRPGDIGVFTDRHALAVGEDKALLDGQIHLVKNLQGPGFLGWQHPPLSAQEAAPAGEPVQTRPATAVSGRTSLKMPALTGIVDLPGR